MDRTRVIVADDEILLREGICSLLNGAGYHVVAQAGSAPELTEAVREHVPALVVVDIRMPPTNTWEGLDAARSIRAEHPETGILLLSAHVEIETAIDLLEGGVGIGYLLKSRVIRTADLVDALERIAQGGCVIDPALVQELVAERHRNDPLAELTAREREVLALMAEGRSNSGIAAPTVVGDQTAQGHAFNVAQPNSSRNAASTTLDSPASRHRRRQLAAETRARVTANLGQISGCRSEDTDSAPGGTKGR